MKIIFFGTPEAAVPFLEALSTKAVGVVTQPDKPGKRGQEIQKSPVKIAAEKQGIPVFQPADLKDPAFASRIAESKADAGIVVAYGKILPPAVISAFPKGIYNIHFSLLPELRGAAPIQWAILRGFKKTGVCAFKIAESLDTGEIFSRREVEISETDDAVSLEKKLIPLGVETLEETLQALQSGRKTGEP